MEHKLQIRGQKPLKAPFGWVGGKSILAREIVSLMPAHKSYVEVFGGAGSVLYHKMPSKIEVFNDINGELINLHLMIKSRPESLKSFLSTLPHSRDIFMHIKNGTLKPRNNIERAGYYFYLIRSSFGSKGDSFAMAKSRKPTNLCRDFSVYARRLKHVSIENMSYEKLIKEYDYNDALFYLDPPYIGTEGYYKTPRGFNMRDHELIASLLKNIKGRFILSYNDCEVVRELYRGFELKERGVNYSLNARARGARRELIITN